MADEQSRLNQISRAIIPDADYMRNDAQLNRLEAEMQRFIQHVRAQNELGHRRHLLVEQIRQGQHAQQQLLELQRMEGRGAVGPSFDPNLIGNALRIMQSTHSGASTPVPAISTAHRAPPSGPSSMNGNYGYAPVQGQMSNQGHQLHSHPSNLNNFSSSQPMNASTQYWPHHPSHFTHNHVAAHQLNPLPQQSTFAQFHAAPGPYPVSQTMEGHFNSSSNTVHIDNAEPSPFVASSSSLSGALGTPTIASFPSVERTDEASEDSSRIVEIDESESNIKQPRLSQQTSPSMSSSQQANDARQDVQSVKRVAKNMAQEYVAQMIDSIHVAHTTPAPPVLDSSHNRPSAARIGVPGTASTSNQNALVTQDGLAAAASVPRHASTQDAPSMLLNDKPSVASTSAKLSAREGHAFSITGQQSHNQQQPQPHHWTYRPYTAGYMSAPGSTSASARGVTTPPPQLPPTFQPQESSAARSPVSTPQLQRNERQIPLRSPQQADKRRLAKDILRALRPNSLLKRRRSTSPESTPLPIDTAKKYRAGVSQQVAHHTPPIVQTSLNGDLSGAIPQFNQPDVPLLATSHSTAVQSVPAASKSWGVSSVPDQPMGDPGAVNMLNGHRHEPPPRTISSFEPTPPESTSAEDAVQFAHHLDEDALTVARVVPSEEVTDESLSRAKKRDIWVEVPVAPGWVHKARERGFTSSSPEDEDFAREVSVALFPRPCRWRECTALLACGKKLGQHLVLHAEGLDSWEPLLCLWESCEQRCSGRQALIQHVQMHEHHTLPCPYADCENTFATMYDLKRHRGSDHGPGALKKISYEPFIPVLNPLPDMPTTMPAYMAITRHITQEPTSSVRRARISPWVYRQIHASTQLYFGSHHAARHPPKTQKISREDVEESLRARRGRGDAYDFLQETPARARRAKLRRPFDELASLAVSEQVLQGVVFDFPEEEDDCEGGECDVADEEWDRDVDTDAFISTPIAAPEFSSHGGDGDSSEDELLLKATPRVNKHDEVAVSTTERALSFHERNQDSVELLSAVNSEAVDEEVVESALAMFD